MIYAKIVDGSVQAYPFNFAQLRQEHPQVSFPSEPAFDLLTEFGVYPVTTVARPSSTVTQDPVEQTPQFINGKWTQVWAMVDVDPETAAARAQDAADQLASGQVKLDAFVQNFVGMTPTQVESYITNNTANLAAVRALLIKMGLMLLILAKRELR